MEIEGRRKTNTATEKDDRLLHESPRQNTDSSKASLERAHEELLAIQAKLSSQARELRKCRSEVSQLRLNRGRYNDLFLSAPIGFLLVDRFQQILSVNSKAAEFLGSSSTCLAQTLLPLYVVPDCRKALSLKLERACRGEAGDIQVRMLSGGRTVSTSLRLNPVKDHKQTGFLCQVSIVTISENRASEMQLKNARDYLHHLATHDALTDLSNRREFYDSLEASLSYARRNANRLAVIVLDLDRFKFVNDSLGHEVGDELLIEVARRLKQKVQTGDTVARLGGDEFSIIIKEVTSETALESVTESIRQIMSIPFKLKRQEVSISASIGVCQYPVDSVHKKDLLKYADAALYKSKSRGGNCVQVFSNNLRLKLESRVQMESDLRSGIQDDDFDTWFQPVHKLESGNIVGLEALVRWRHPRQGLIAPAAFIGLAEDCGVIEKLGKVILEQSCANLVSLHAHGFNTLSLSINVSSHQLQRDILVRQVADVLNATGLDPKLLEIELTEAVLFNEPRVSKLCLSELKAIGVKLVVDNFGVGFSSFNKLRRLPISKIKIDQSFVSGVPFDPDACSIVKAIVSIAQDLGIAVVSEGVETTAQLNFLTDVGCDLAQGFLLSNPVCATAIESTLVNNRAAKP